MPSKLKIAPVIAAPNVIPMADIMLVLLIIFMVIAPLIGRPVSVSMAQTENAEKMPNAQRDDAVIVAITHDGRLFLSPGNKELQADELTSTVKNLVEDRTDKTIYVRSDARAKYGDVVRTVDQIREAGVENLGLLTEKVPPKPYER